MGRSSDGALALLGLGFAVFASLAIVSSLVVPLRRQWMLIAVQCSAGPCAKVKVLCDDQHTPVSILLWLLLFPLLQFLFHQRAAAFLEWTEIRGIGELDKADIAPPNKLESSGAP
jgi:hypothetical protein